ncbi:butyrophilin-like protein 3 [Chaetodon trifascialis]|uniref:butyrophilin-like protein 3 n=1 Tax=Chaetodon trifascialis TaxID=109706 RepID=UPI003992651E
MKDSFALDFSTMGSLVVRTCLMAALGASLCGAPPVSDNFLVLVKSSVSVRRGHTVTLPCWLSPPQSAESQKVKWYRFGRDSPIALYRDKKFEYGSQEPSYAGRLSFGLKDAASGGLAAGDVSLQLANVTLEDAGLYTCYVSSDQGHDKGDVTLIVTETGSPPLLSAVWKENNMMNVSCESGGWYPEPTVLWSNQKQALTASSLKFSQDSSGLWSVHSWLLVSNSTEVSCSVGLSGEEAKEARLRLNSPPQPSKQDCGSSWAGWLAFALLLIATLAALGYLFFKKRVKKSKAEIDQAGETRKLLPKGVIEPTDLSTAKKHYVNVTLDQKGNQYLKIEGHVLRQGDGPFPDGQKVTCLTAVKGTPGFSSGQHYWEVSMRKSTDYAVVKRSWWVGVTSAAVIPQEPDFTPTASNGFWFLSSSPDTAGRFQLSTETRVLQSVSSRPWTVGVYVNYDSGELSFYNVEEKSLIGSLTATFTGEVFPFFNPGKGDRAPMEILQESSDRVNSADSTA